MPSFLPEVPKTAMMRLLLAEIEAGKKMNEIFQEWMISIFRLGLSSQKMRTQILLLPEGLKAFLEREKQTKRLRLGLFKSSERSKPPKLNFIILCAKINFTWKFLFVHVFFRKVNTRIFLKAQKICFKRNFEKL